MHDYNAVDEYIDKAQTFAQPIMLRIRELVHEACPQVEETLKWGMPHFVYKRKNLCGMAAFKAHCSFGFWYAALLRHKYPQFQQTPGEGMGHLGKMTSLKDLPSKRIMLSALRDAVSLIDNGAKLPATPVKTTKKEIVLHPEFTKALKTNKKAATTFETFSPSHRWEYTSWINEAKTDATLQRRIATTIDWLQQGKDRNWKYRK